MLGFTSFSPAYSSALPDPAAILGRARHRVTLAATECRGKAWQIRRGSIRAHIAGGMHVDAGAQSRFLGGQVLAPQRRPREKEALTCVEAVAFLVIGAVGWAAR